jgi:AcrR family transcriptional regulator
MSDSCPKVRPRDRIIETAAALFREHGIRGVGVDTIAEAAGSNKMTLYRHFGSKDELVAECLRMQAEQGAEKWARLEREHPGDPLGQLHGWIALIASYLKTETHGCDLANAAVELHEEGHPAWTVIGTFKAEQLQKLVATCRAAGARDPDLLADTLYLLVEGARLSRQINGADGPSAVFVRAAEAAVAASISRNT